MEADGQARAHRADIGPNHEAPWSLEPERDFLRIPSVRGRSAHFTRTPSRFGGMGDGAFVLSERSSPVFRREATGRKGRRAPGSGAEGRAG